MSSTRLPGKVLLPINKKSMLECVIHQTKQSKFIDEVIVATTKNKEDDKIVNFCKKNNVLYFRGSKNDVLDRYYQCAKKFNCKVILRITSDCPLIDPNVIDRGIEIFFQKSLDYIGNNIDYKNKKWQNATCNFPQGMTVEICKFDVLKKAWRDAKKPSEREHVFPYVQFNPKVFLIGNFKKNTDFSYIRCTVDRQEDLKFVREIYKKLKNYSNAKRYLYKVRNLHSLFFTGKYPVLNYLNIAELFLEEKNYDSAAYYLSKAEKAPNNQMTLYFYATINYDYAILNKDTSNFELAIIFIEQCIHFAKMDNNERRLAEAHNIMGEILIELNEHTNALMHFNQAFEAAIKLKNEHLELRIHKNFYLLEFEKGNIMNALAHILIYTELKFIQSLFQDRLPNLNRYTGLKRLKKKIVYYN